MSLVKCDLMGCVSNMGRTCIGDYKDCPYYKLVVKFDEYIKGERK